LFVAEVVAGLLQWMLQKWLGLQGIPRGFIPQIYTVLKKLPQTQ